MKIENLRTEKRGHQIAALATVTWEDNDHPRQELFFETDSIYADSLSCNPNAFLLACAIPALHFKEKRIVLEDEVCPELVDGLNTAMHWLRQWYYEPERKIVAIEARKQGALSNGLKAKRAGTFFSGGVDSFATLKLNRLNFAASHPWAIKDGLVAYGLELDKVEAFDYVLDYLKIAASEAGLQLIPVRTNIYLEYREADRQNNFDFWTYKFQGAVLAAIAHAFAKRLGVMSIAATYDLAYLNKWGSHPLLDPNYSSVDLRIRHDGLVLSRLQKVELIKDWELALRHLRVCNQGQRYEAGNLNCGRCEKCIRTALELLVVGRLDRCTALPCDDVTGDMIRQYANIHSDYNESCYLDLIPALNKRGRKDLVQAIAYRLDIYHAKKQKKNPLLEKIRRFDQEKLNGRISGIKKRFKRIRTS
jgi:hypothetical protein